MLPATFEELQRPFAVGVVDARGIHRVVARGPLPAAVAASAAIPLIFTPVRIPGAAAPGRHGRTLHVARQQPWLKPQRTSPTFTETGWRIYTPACLSLQDTAYPLATTPGWNHKGRPRLAQ